MSLRGYDIQLFLKDGGKRLRIQISFKRFSVDECCGDGCDGVFARDLNIRVQPKRNGRIAQAGEQRRRVKLERGRDGKELRVRQFYGVKKEGVVHVLELALPRGTLGHACGSKRTRMLRCERQVTPHHTHSVARGDELERFVNRLRLIAAKLALEISK